jgi:alanyl-tRNA synthetase
MPKTASRTRKETVPAAASAGKIRYTVQVASYPDKVLAEDEMKRMKKRGYAAFIAASELPDKGTWYRVRLGSFSTKTAAERLANEIILENRVVDIRFVTRDEAEKLGLRKLPPAERDELRIIDIRDFDLTACGGTHVSQTGQIGCILLRKTEKVRQGWRVEFVAGQRAVATAQRDFMTLTETAALFSAHIYDVPQQARKALDEIRSLWKQREQSQEELAEAQAAALLAQTPDRDGRKIVIQVVSDRDLNFIKLLAQKITRRSTNAVALLATTSPQPSLVFAQSAGQPFDMGALLKEVMAKLGGRGGGTKDMAQGGTANPQGLEKAIHEVGEKLSERGA